MELGSSHASIRVDAPSLLLLPPRAAALFRGRRLLPSVLGGVRPVSLINVLGADSNTTRQELDGPYSDKG